MPSDEQQQESSSILNGLLTPWRLPERAIQALESLAEAARDIPPIRADIARVRELAEPPLSELMPAVERIDSRAKQLVEMAPVVERISEQAQPLNDLLPVLERLVGDLASKVDSLNQVVGELESEESHLNKTVGALASEFSEMHETVKALRGDVERVTDHLPSNRGPIQTARYVPTGARGDDA